MHGKGVPLLRVSHMSVRIENNIPGGNGTADIGRSSDVSGSRVATDKLGTGPTDQGGDRVELSSLSGGVASSIASANGQQAERVRQLAALYASGRYEVDPAKISHALVSDSIRSGSITSGQV